MCPCLPSSLPQLTIDFECRSLEVIVPGSSPALHALMGPSWAGTGAGALLLKLRWKFKDVRACLVPTACGGLLLSVKQPPWVSRCVGALVLTWPLNTSCHLSLLALPSHLAGALHPWRAARGLHGQCPWR